MKRYAGEPLDPGHRVAVIANDALGNFVVSTPLLQMLRERGAGSLAYFGGSRTWEFIAASGLIDFGYPLFGSEPRCAAAALAAEGPYDLVVNIETSAAAKVAAAVLAGSDGLVCGPSLDGECRSDLPFQDDLQGRLWADVQWTAPDLTQRYPNLKTGFIGEIFCRCAYLDGPIPAYRVPESEPSRPIPDILVATSASLTDKLWTPEGWREALRMIAGAGLTAGLLGAKPSLQGRYWEGATVEDSLIEEGLVTDLRGAFTLPQVVGALRACKGVLTLDNGILHLACAAERPVVGLYREGIHRLWAPPWRKLRVITAEPGMPVQSIAPEDVLGAIESDLIAG